MNICCYHGTDEASSQSILSSKEFIVKRRQDHWLGNGVYFFIDDFKKAEWWANQITKKNGKLPVVLYLNLDVDDTELLNLNIESDLDTLNNFSKELFKDLKKYNVFIKFKDEHELNCFVLDRFFEKYPNYKVVRRTFNSTNKKVGESGFGMLSDQICIMNQEIIPFSKIKVKNIS